MIFRLLRVKNELLLLEAGRASSLKITLPPLMDAFVKRERRWNMDARVGMSFPCKRFENKQQNETRFSDIYGNKQSRIMKRDYDQHHRLAAYA